MVKKRVIVLLALLPLVALYGTSCSSEPEAGPPLEGEIIDLAEEFIDNLVDENYSSAAAFFNAQMKKAMPERKLKQAWEQLLQQAGPYKGVLEKRFEQGDDYAAVNVITEFAEMQLNIRVVFDGDNRVAGLWFQPAE